MFTRFCDTENLKEIGDGSTRNESLGPVDDVLIAFQKSQRSYGGNITPRIGFGDSSSGDGFCLNQRRYPLLFLLLCAKKEDHLRTESPRQDEMGNPGINSP